MKYKKQLIVTATVLVFLIAIAMHVTNIFAKSDLPSSALPELEEQMQTIVPRIKEQRSIIETAQGVLDPLLEEKQKILDSMAPWGYTFDFAASKAVPLD